MPPCRCCPVSNRLRISFFKARPGDRSVKRQDAMAAELELSVQQIRERRDAGEELLILDVREPAELQTAALDGTLNIPMGEIPSRYNEVPDDRPVVVMCHHGMRSLQVMMWLRKNDYDNVINMAGGIEAWSTHIDPSVPRY